MNGKIYFEDLSEMAEFLKHFTGSTATFECRMNGSGKWELEFLRGF